MDICGDRFVTGGGDKLIKVTTSPANRTLHGQDILNPQVWDYDRGEVTHVGVGHSGEVTKVKVSPDGYHTVSVSVDGAILRWLLPHDPQQPSPPTH